ncbi:MAG: DUF6495 family protein [Bacteroidota bacterium]
MKYSRLTKEQFEELHEEFINFLASQSITAEEWNDIKANKPEVAEQELDVFSDLVWHGVLEKVKYLEHISKDQIHLFNCMGENISLIAVVSKKEEVDISSPEGYHWLRQNLMSEDVEFFNATKNYDGERSEDIFRLIKKGAVITQGELFEYFDKIIH